MGLRFHKSFKVAPGVKINLNKKSAGVTLGTKGAHYTVNTSGRRTASVGIPGTGLSYSTTSGGGKKGAKKRTPSTKSVINKWIAIIIAIVAILCVAGALKDNFSGKSDTTPKNVVTAQVPSYDTAANADAVQATVWISESGKKYHTKSNCSGMENATEVTLQEALDMGKEPCKRCN